MPKYRFYQICTTADFSLLTRFYLSMAIYRRMADGYFSPRGSTLLVTGEKYFILGHKLGMFVWSVLFYVFLEILSVF